MDQLDYYQFMGHSSELLRYRYEPYAAQFPPAARVVDIGCGRGEFLELLRERGVDGLGVDADESMVAEAQRKGLKVSQSDATAFLTAHSGAFDGVFAAHVVEHLAPEQLHRFVMAAGGALRPGGRLILVTPNPANLQMQLRDFWVDLQHVRFYTREIITFLVHLAGLSQIESAENPRYRTGLDFGLETWPALPRERPPAKAIGRMKMAQVMLPSIEGRLSDLERRVNQMTEWMGSLYPPAEYYVTGVR